MYELLFGTTLLTAFAGGVVALLAPCCVSVMLPAYLSTVFRRRGGTIAATGIFALGVATVIVPIGLGASALAALFVDYHTPVFSVGGAAMIVGGLAILGGWQPRLPMLGGRGPSGRGVGSVYALGLFSGAASSCCAPVLAGVILLGGATASFPAALTVAGTYVAGMVAPLMALAFLWDRRAARKASSWMEGRRIQVRLGRWSRQIPLGYALSGGLLVLMGALTLVLAVSGTGMSSTGWQLRISADIQHVASWATRQLSWLSGWAVAVLLLTAALVLIFTARRRGQVSKHHSCCDSKNTESHPAEVTTDES
ncbi:cytochrome c biogenesis protein CcdA [Allosaccharopolyspora coralli]|uniref:Cytochrome c biogenesis protein CcdA n=1 Tax=Allosaccharopolyspora coralli TaxID=2665642 RepID=A0A5Q3QHE9_9PSEU|nr:cytochrome c biogenesis CcdA family protein [Allosaccharopolyspora coralli]QGK70257.1 cytochrome c biogenesis protein CcdA [Allosaccharopolyspora coralli]